MNRQRADSEGSMRPDDEVMPYSDDETDEELGDTSDSESEGEPEVPQPDLEPRAPGVYSTKDMLFKSFQGRLV